jgi:hypothetical protein
MANGDVKDYKKFGHQNGVDLRDYFENQSKMLSDAMRQRIADLEEKLTNLIKANDTLYMTKFSDSKEAVKDAFTASQTAITKSEVSSEKRSDAVYVSIVELQKALSSVVGRQEHDLSIKGINDKLDLSVKTLDEKIDGLSSRATGSESKGIGITAGMGYVALVIGVVATIISIILGFAK